MCFFLLMAAYGVSAVVLETTLLAGWPVDVLRVDLVLPAVAAISFYRERRQALPVLVLYGVLMDVASSAPFGTAIFSYLVIYTGVRAIVSMISFQRGAGLLFWVAVISLADKGISALLLLISTGEARLPAMILGRAPAQALLDAITGLGVIPFLTWYWDLSWEKLRKPKGLVLR
jgi:membrane-associated HD superfamily phosphohydrolase